MVSSRRGKLEANGSFCWVACIQMLRLLMKSMSKIQERKKSSLTKFYLKLYFFSFEKYHQLCRNANGLTFQSLHRNLFLPHLMNIWWCFSFPFSDTFTCAFSIEHGSNIKPRKNSLPNYQTTSVSQVFIKRWSQYVKMLQWRRKETVIHLFYRKCSGSPISEYSL